MKLKKLIKELDNDDFYLSLYIENRRVYGDFCYNCDTTLKKYSECEVLDIEPLENSNIVKVKLEKCEEEEIVDKPILEEKEEKTKNGNKRRNTTSKKSSRLS